MGHKYRRKKPCPKKEAQGQIIGVLQDQAKDLPDLKERAIEAWRKIPSSKARPRAPVNTDASPAMRIGK
jgi:hypothetical protein